MPKVAKTDWELGVLRDFDKDPNNFNRYFVEKLVEMGFMSKETVQKEVKARGRNPVRYSITETGRAFMNGAISIVTETEVAKPVRKEIKELFVQKTDPRMTDFLKNIDKNWNAEDREVILHNTRKFPKEKIPDFVKELYSDEYQQRQACRGMVETYILRVYHKMF